MDGPRQGLVAADLGQAESVSVEPPTRSAESSRLPAFAWAIHTNLIIYFFSQWSPWPWVDLLWLEKVWSIEVHTKEILNWKLTLLHEISWIRPLSLAPHFGAAKVAKTFGGRRSPRLKKIRWEGPLSQLLPRNWIYKLQRRFMGETNCSIRAFTVAAWEKGERGKVRNCTFFKCLFLCKKQKFTFLQFEKKQEENKT